MNQHARAEELCRLCGGKMTNWNTQAIGQIQAETPDYANVSDEERRNLLRNAPDNQPGGEGVGGGRAVKRARKQGA